MMDLVIVVDDSSVIRSMYLIVLAGRFVTIGCKDAQEALPIIKQKKPRLVITDQNMPDMKGTELAAKIRSDPSLKEVKIILISSEDGLPTTNFDAHLVKASESRLKPQDLLDCIARVLR